MLITVAVLALVPCSGFVQRTWAGASRTVTRAKTDETYNGMYDRRGRPCRGEPNPKRTYYTWKRTVVKNPAAWSGTIRKRGDAPPLHTCPRARAAGDVLCVPPRVPAAGVSLVPRSFSYPFASPSPSLPGDSTLVSWVDNSECGPTT